MTTREQLLALNEELRRLKADGRRTVSVSEESLATLRAALADEPQEEVGRSGFTPDVAYVPTRVEISGVKPDLQQEIRKYSLALPGTGGGCYRKSAAAMPTADRDLHPPGRRQGHALERAA